MGLSSAEPGADSITPDDRAYDRALAALARGETIDVDLLCREARAAGGSDGLRERLEALRHVARRAASDSRPPFERLGEFRLIRSLGEGSMGVVWLAEQESLKRLVALKMIRAERIGSKDAEARFEREAIALGRLRHPNVVSVFAAGEAHGVRYLAMELVDGESLADRLKASLARGELPDVPVVLGNLLEVARALSAAHDVGLVHRDVKPSNVLIGRDGSARLTDFGIALDVGAPALTQSSGFLGTPFYAAPEQVAGKRDSIGPRSDVYALGATLYEATTGIVPFPAVSTDQALHAILHAELVPPRKRNASLSRDLEIVIEKAMERDAERRYESAAAFASDLEALLALRPIAARPPSSLLRVGRRLRARPRLAATLAAVALLTVAIPLAVSWRGRAAASATLAAAESHLAALRGAREGMRQLEKRDGALVRDRLRRPLSDDESTRVRHAQAEQRALEFRRDEAFHAGLAVTARAASLGADEDAIVDLRAQFFLELWRERIDVGDHAGAAALVPRIVENDPGGEHRAELEGLATVTLLPDPPDAEIYLFRYREHAEIAADAERRLVPVPVGGETAVVPGSIVLRVVKGAGDFSSGDLVLEVAGRSCGATGSLFAAADAPPIRRLDRLIAIDGEPVRDRYELWILSTARIGVDGLPVPAHRYAFERGGSGADDGASAGPVAERGATIVVESLHDAGPPVEIVDARALAERGGVRARVFRDGKIDEVVLPAGLTLRPTAAPLPLDPALRIAGPVRLPAGSYLAVLRTRGHGLQRVPFVLDRGAELTLRPRLLPAETIPDGFIHVPAGSVPLGGDPELPNARETRAVESRGFLIQEREVTFLEWKAFLDDPETRAEIDSSPILIRMPRFPANAASGGYLERGQNGRVLLPLEWIEWPVMGVSAEDAEAFARWRTKRARAEGLAITFRLPAADEWEKAARGADLRRYPYGDPFHPRFAKNALARPIRGDTPFDVSPEPVISFLIDESPYGVYDLSGSQREWTASDLSRTPTEVLRELRGGAWNDSEPHVGRVAYRFGMSSRIAEAGFGLRLAADEVAR